MTTREEPVILATRVQTVELDLPEASFLDSARGPGLAEIAVNRGRPDRELGLSIGTPVQIVV